MKDIIQVTLDDGSVKNMELVFSFNFENNDYTYIIYRDNDEERFFLAKFLGEYSENTELVTDFDDEELKKCNRIFEGVVENETRS